MLKVIYSDNTELIVSSGKAVDLSAIPDLENVLRIEYRATSNKLEYNKIYQKLHSAKHKEAVLKWRRNNREKYNAYQRSYRRKKLQESVFGRRKENCV